MTTIQAFSPPLGPQPPNAQFFSSEQVTLRMKEKVLSLSGDDFTVTTAEETPVLVCKGKTFSLHAKKTFEDLQGKEIFTLEKKLMKLQSSFHGESPEGHNFDITGKFSIGSSKSTVEFVNHADGAPIELQVKGDWLDRKAEITLGDRPVAQISRSFFNARELLGGQQTYFVTIAPNVDLSLMAAICVCLDERENDK